MRGRLAGVLLAAAVTGLALPSVATAGHESVRAEAATAPVRERASGPSDPIEVVEAANVAGLIETFSGMNYRLADILHRRAAVPRVFLAKLPPDIATLRSADDRKRLFIKSLLPLVLQTNESIRAKRERLLDLMGHRLEGRHLSWTDEAWLGSLAEEYAVDPGDLERLRRRVDVVPPGLAIAQAAAESGWGTSRFAHRGNAVFGQRTWTRGGGLVPGRRDQDKRHEVKKFDGLGGSVAAYMMNLNRHTAYRAFRDRRAAMRRTGNRFDSFALAETLTRYAETGDHYIDTLHAIMRVNRLHMLDGAQLAVGAPEKPRQPDI